MMSETKLGRETESERKKKLIIIIIIMNSTKLSLLRQAGTK